MSADASTLVALEGVEFRYPDRRSTARRPGRPGAHIGPIDATIPFGSAVSLMGPNGSGKSTVARLISGSLRPAAGHIRWRGRPIVPSRDRTYRGRIGVVFQTASIDDRLTVRQSLLFGATLYGVSPSDRADREARVVRAAAEVGVEALLDEEASRLSGGQLRRADLARALLHDPELLVLDEPTTGLDEAAFRRFWDLISHLRLSRGLSVVVATHRPDEAERCSTVVVLHRGQVASTGTPEALRGLVDHDSIVAAGPRLDRVEAAAQRLGLQPERGASAVVAKAPNAAAVVPRWVEEAGEGEIRSISVRRADLSDAFAAITGEALSPAPLAPHEEVA